MTRAIMVSVALLLSTRTAGADTPIQHHVIKYRVKQGDTLPIIAAEVYGDRAKAIFIMSENKIAHVKPLKPGAQLRIPAGREITTKPGDTWEALAASYLGDDKRAAQLAQFNKLTTDDTLAAGRSLYVPFMVLHTAAATESLASISAAYFGETGQAEMLRQYNFREKKSLEKGESILVPVFHVRLVEAKAPQPSSEAKALQQKRRAATDGAAKALPRAWQAWRAGYFAEIEKPLEKLEIDYLDADAAADVCLLRGLAQIAVGKPDAAAAEFGRARERKPSLVLRKFDYSPKIVEVWERAGGKSE